MVYTTTIIRHTILGRSKRTGKRRCRISSSHSRMHLSAYYPGDTNVYLFGYSDADYANNVENRRSITGYVSVFAGAPLTWNSMTQHSVGLSTMEAEYFNVCKAVQKGIYLRMLFEESGMKVDESLVIKEDNLLSPRTQEITLEPSISTCELVIVSGWSMVSWC